MPITVFWDANFKVKALEPVLQDMQGFASPGAYAASTPKILYLVTALDPESKTKAILFQRDIAQSSCKIKITVSKTAAAQIPAIVDEPGEIQVNLNDRDFMLPTEGINFVTITNLESGTRNINTIFLNH